MATNLSVLGGLVIFGVSAVVWLLVLSRASLSFAYPFASLSYLLIVLVGAVRAARAGPAAALGGRRLHHGRDHPGRPDPTRVSAPAAELAVVIVNYNTGAYLERCLASLAAHRGDVALDVLVIDNASRDGSHMDAVAAHPWARLIENPRTCYLSPAWNQGLRETDAPFVLLLNPDAEIWRGRSPNSWPSRGPTRAPASWDRGS